MYRAYGEYERQRSQWLRQPVTAMAHPEVADGGDGVQICRVTVQY
jgi:hypothetical protein